MPSYVKQLTLWHAVIIAAILVLVSIIVVRRGILNSLLWIGAIAVLVVGAVNYFSYGGGGYRG